MGNGSYKLCPGCMKERATTRTGVMAPHNMWNGQRMVSCPGRGHKPAGLFRRMLK
jgi:hypothetical protein